MKIFIGIHEIANNVKEFSDALSQAGYHVKTLGVPNKLYSDNKYTYTLTIPRVFRKSKVGRFLYPTLILPFYLPLIFKFDVFIFIWSITFLPLNLDLLLLRLLRKKVLIFNCGDDVRYRPIHQEIDEAEFKLKRFEDKSILNAYLKGGITFIRAFYTQKIEEWSGCDIISMRNQATFQRRSCYLFRFPTQKIINEPKLTNPIPLIIHAPSGRMIKGTKYVIEAIELLREEGLNFQFELIENRDNKYVISRLIAADIIIDQPGTWIAKFASEGLAAGCIVIGGNRPDYEGFENASPVIQFNPSTSDLANILRELIRDEVKRQTLMNNSYCYWKNTYSTEAFVQYFEDIMTGKAKKFSPLPNHKQLLLDFASNNFQKLLIRLFY